jgi:hypothetical protein
MSSRSDDSVWARGHDQIVTVDRALAEGKYLS